MKTNRTLTRILIISLLLVWGTVGYRIVTSIDSGSEEPIGAVPPDSIGRAHQTFYVYTDDVRDPFHYIIAGLGTTKKSQKPSTATPPWTPPPLKLTGIVAGSERRTATLQSGDGSVHFLNEGDKLCGAKILKISPSKVTYLYVKKKDEWVLGQQ